MVDGDRYCADILTQLSSVQEALRAVGRELMRNHLRHCAAEAIRTGGAPADAMYEELVDLMDDWVPASSAECECTGTRARHQAPGTALSTLHSALSTC